MVFWVQGSRLTVSLSWCFNGVTSVSPCVTTEGPCSVVVSCCVICLLCCCCKVFSLADVSLERSPREMGHPLSPKDGSPSVLSETLGGRLRPVEEVDGKVEWGSWQRASCYWKCVSRGWEEIPCHMGAASVILIASDPGALLSPAPGLHPSPSKGP